MRDLFLIALLASTLALAAPVQAAQMVSPSAPAASSGAAAPPPAAGVSRRIPGASEINANGPPIVLEVGKGTLLRLPRAASTVFIANPDIADVQVKSPSLIYVSAKAPGDTVIYAVDSANHVLLNSPVRVEHDLSRLRQSLHALIPGDDIKVKSVAGSVVLSGNVASAGQAQKADALATSIAGSVKGSKVVNQLSVMTPNQVSVHVRIAEVDRNVLKEMGINWSKLSGNFQFSTSNPTTVGPESQNFLSYAIALPGNTTRLNAELDALAQEGYVTNLAEPNLTAVSGQSASFLAGGEFPVPVVSGVGAGASPTVTIEFKKFGVALDMVPTIIDAGHISLRVRPSVSQLSQQGAVQISGFTIPALTERSAETTVELGSGQSFALAGLLQHNTEQDVSKFPWLGDVPILGALFRSDRFQDNESELVIIITPYLVQPTETALTTPVKGYVSPHDFQRIITGATYRQGLPGPARGPIGAGGQGLIGPAGFRLD